MKFTEDGLLNIYNYQRQHGDDSYVLVDVGAHHGVISKMFAQKSWQVIAFEPERSNLASFKSNLADFPNVRCVAKAVCDVNGDKIPFYVSKEHYGIHSLKPWHETHELAYEVDTVRLDTILEDLCVKTVTLLKIDVEGADFLALKSFDFAKYKPDLVMIEFMDSRTQPNFGYNHHDVVNYMASHGYCAFVSEWSEIKEYGREGKITEPHVWLQCVTYPLDHEPAWGNLFFVPISNKEKFNLTLQSYLKQLKREALKSQLGDFIRKIPGAKHLYRWLIHR